MTAAAPARHFGAHHPQVILTALDRARLAIVEAWLAGAAFKLLLRLKNRLLIVSAASKFS